MSKEAHRVSALDEAISTALQRRRLSSTLRRLSTAPHGSVDFSSNDFLSLSGSALLRHRLQQELDSHPLSPLGSGGSRLLDGNTPYAVSLEKTIAIFHHAPTALLTNSGYDANVAIFSALAQQNDIIIYDALIHASVHDGMRTSRSPSAQHFAFQHNSVESFASVLRHALDDFPQILEGRASIFVALEAVYSMDGDVAPLTKVLAAIDTAVPREVRQNIHLVVDEAHSTGVLGPQGRGLVSSLGLEHRVSIRLHTFGKALAANGAAILCDENIKAYLLNYARGLIYTTFLSFPALALVRASYGILMDEQAGSLVERLRGNMQALHRELVALHDEVQAASRKTNCDLISINGDSPDSPIFSVETCDPRSLAAYCQGRGYVVRPIVAPTVPYGAERVRVCLHSGNTREQIEGLVGCMRQWCNEQLDRRRQERSQPRLDPGHSERAKL